MTCGCSPATRCAMARAMQQGLVRLACDNTHVRAWQIVHLRRHLAAAGLRAYQHDGAVVALWRVQRASAAQSAAEVA